MEEETWRRLSSASRNAEGERLSSSLGCCFDVGVSAEEVIWGSQFSLSSGLPPPEDLG